MNIFRFCNNYILTILVWIKQRIDDKKEKSLKELNLNFWQLFYKIMEWTNYEKIMIIKN